MRKGSFSLDELGSVILAVIILIIVGVGVFKIIDVVKNDEIENIGETLDKILERVNSIGQGESGEFTLQGFEGSKEWFITGWSKDEAKSPDQCLFESCICLCKGKGESRESLCNESGFCKNVKEKEIAVSSVVSYEEQSFLGGESSPTTTAIYKEKTVNYIDLPSTLLRISVKKMQDKVEITTDKQSANQLT